MRPVVLACSLLCLMVGGPLAAQRVPPELRDAAVAWDEGDYVS